LREALDAGGGLGQHTHEDAVGIRLGVTIRKGGRNGAMRVTHVTGAPCRGAQTTLTWWRILS
jgi:hypothetical protein